MSHVATGCLIAAFFILASASGSVSFSTLLAGGVLAGPLRDVVFLLLLPRLRREGRHHPAARLAAGSASGRAQQHLRPDVRRADQDRHLRHRPVLRLWPGHAAILVGRARPRARGAVGRSRRAVCAHAARSQAPAGLSQHREHRHHPAGRGRRHDGARRAASPVLRRSASPPVSTTC